MNLTICLNIYLSFHHLAAVLGPHYHFQVTPVSPFRPMAMLVSLVCKQKADYLIQIIVSLQLDLGLSRCLLVLHSDCPGLYSAWERCSLFIACSPSLFLHPVWALRQCLIDQFDVEILGLFVIWLLAG